MKIVVCIKQVPILKEAPMDKEKGVLLRTGDKRINPCDLTAIETAVRFKEKWGGTVCALTMGPESSEQVLRTALSMGADEGYLMCDRAFSGADVLITAKTLAEGIKKIGNVDLIVCGQQTTDGDTAQVPYSLAEQIGYPIVGWIKNLEIMEDYFICYQELTEKTYKVQCKCPLVISVGMSAVEVRTPSLKSKLLTNKCEIHKVGLLELEDSNPQNYGLSASPTRVSKLFTISLEEKEPLMKMNAGKAAEILLSVYEKNRKAE